MKKDVIAPVVTPEKMEVSKKTYKRRHIFFDLLLIVLAVSIIILSFLAKSNPYFWFDVVITKAIQSINNPAFDFVMRFISELGNFHGTVLMITLVGALFYWKGRKLDSLIIVGSSVTMAFVSTALKYIIQRPRPGEYALDLGRFFSNDSFPSGHVLHYMGLYGVVLFLLYAHYKHTPLKRLLMVALLLLIILGGVSRIYLGAHWFSDTLGAYLIGLLWLYIISFISHRVETRPKN